MQLSEPARQRLGELGVAAVWLFGSRARHEDRPGSDVDVAVLLRDEARLGFLDQGRVANTVAEDLHVEEVDLVVLNTAPLELRAAVVREGRLLARLDEPRRVRFEVETLSRWIDVRPAVAAQTRAFLARVAREGLP